MTLWDILKLNTEVQRVLSVSTSLCQSYIKPNKPSRPQPAESASCQIAFHFKAFRWSAKNEKVTRMKCSLGSMPNSPQLRQLSAARNPFDYSGLWRKVNKQIRATTRKHSLVFTVKTSWHKWPFLLSVRACLRHVYASREPSLTPVRDSGDNMPRFCL